MTRPSNILGADGEPFPYEEPKPPLLLEFFAYELIPMVKTSDGWIEDLTQPRQMRTEVIDHGPDTRKALRGLPTEETTEEGLEGNNLGPSGIETGIVPGD